MKRKNKRKRKRGRRGREEKGEEEQEEEKVEEEEEEGEEEEEEEEEEQQKQKLQASAKLTHRMQQVADYQPGDRLKKGTQIFILLLVQQKVDHEAVFPPSGSNSTQQQDTFIFM